MITWESIPTAVKVWVGSISAATFFCTLIIIPIVIVRMSPDYFIPKAEPPETWVNQHPVIRWSALILKNILGFILVIMGLILSIPLVPGQGLLTILLGLVLMNFPGKTKAELWLIRRPAIRKSINWIREKADQPPLLLPEPSPGIRPIEQS